METPRRTPKISTWNEVRDRDRRKIKAIRESYRNLPTPRPGDEDPIWGSGGPGLLLRSEGMAVDELMSRARGVRLHDCFEVMADADMAIDLGYPEDRPRRTGPMRHVTPPVRFPRNTFNPNAPLPAVPG